MQSVDHWMGLDTDGWADRMGMDGQSMTKLDITET